MIVDITLNYLFTYTFEHNYNKGMRPLNTFTKLLCVFGVSAMLFLASLFFQIQTVNTPYTYAATSDGAGSFFMNCNFDNPGKDNIVCVIKNITNDLVKIVGALIIVIVVISGIMYIVSAGNPEQTALAKKTLVGAIIGLIIVLLSYFMVAVIIKLLS